MSTSNKAKILKRAAKRGRALPRVMKDKKSGASAKARAEAVRRIRALGSGTVELFVKDEKTGDLRELSQELEILASFDTRDQNSRGRNSAPAIIPKLAEIVSKARQAKRFIEPKRTDEKPSGTIAERRAKFDEYVRNHPEKTPLECMDAVFPAIAILAQRFSPDFPARAPALWAQDKQEGDTPPDFIKRHYGAWLGKGFGQPEVKALDERLYMALHNWLRNNEMPSDLDLPTLKEQNDRLAQALEDMGLDMNAITNIGHNMRNRS